MACNNVQRENVVSSKCFRLLYLRHEIQTDMKVLKPVVDEVNVLRLCQSLGMTLSSKTDPDSMHKFEFGIFDADDYDTDFARFVREKLLARYPSKGQEDGQDKDVLEIGCLFGKQLEVKAELTRMGFWDNGCDERLSLQDQGVYCLEGNADHHQFVVFAWLAPSLFEPDAIRDTPTYVLRLLLTLNPNITCCLSQEDFRCVKSEVDVMSASSSMRWNSYSVAFRVQNQVEQQDGFTCNAVTKVSIPKSDRVKAVWFVDGVVPSVAVENLIPSATEWITEQDVTPCSSFAQWLWEKHEKYLIELKPRLLDLTTVRDNTLERFDYFPEDEINALRKNCSDEFEKVKQQFCYETYERAKKTYEDAVQDANVLFAVRCSANSSQMDSVLRQYTSFLQQCKNFETVATLEPQVRNMLYLPDRIQKHMVLLGDAYSRHLPKFMEMLDAIVAGVHVNDTANIYRSWLRQAIQVTLGWIWRSSDQPSCDFQLAMEQRQLTLLPM